MELEELIIRNFNFGDFISEFIEYKYSQIKHSNNGEEINMKWFYLPYNIVIIGQSFFSKKYIT